jgi:hypothetical protein
VGEYFVDRSRFTVSVRRDQLSIKCWWWILFSGGAQCREGVLCGKWKLIAGTRSSVRGRGVWNLVRRVLTWGRGKRIKGTVSLDIGLHFRFWKIKLVLSARPLMVLTFFYLVVPEIFKY